LPREGSPLHKLFSGLERRLTGAVSGCSIAIAAANTRFSLASSMPARYCRKVASAAWFRRRIDAQSFVLVFRKKPNCRSSPQLPPSLSIPAATANAQSLSALSSVTAKRRIARCHALIIQACDSFGPSRNFMSVTIDGSEREYDLTLGCHRDQQRRHAHHVRPSTNTRPLMFHLSPRHVGGLINQPAIGIPCVLRRRKINALGGTVAGGACSAVRSRRMSWASSVGEICNERDFAVLDEINRWRDQARARQQYVGCGAADGTGSAAGREANGPTPRRSSAF
jgi:hypothetical protein